MANHQAVRVKLTNTQLIPEGPFHGQCKKIAKTKTDDLDLLCVYFSSIMSYEYPLI